MFDVKKSLPETSVITLSELHGHAEYTLLTLNVKVIDVNAPLTVTGNFQVSWR